MSTTDFGSARDTDASVTDNTMNCDATRYDSLRCDAILIMLYE